MVGGSDDYEVIVDKLAYYIGDFNARTGQLSDLVHLTDDDDDVNYFVNIFENHVHIVNSHANVAVRVTNLVNKMCTNSITVDYIMV